jgi:hypothetical protein
MTTLGDHDRTIRAIAAWLSLGQPITDIRIKVGRFASAGGVEIILSREDRNVIICFGPHNSMTDTDADFEGYVGHELDSAVAVLTSALP